MVPFPPAPPFSPLLAFTAKFVLLQSQIQLILLRPLPSPARSPSLPGTCNGLASGMHEYRNYCSYRPGGLRRVLGARLSQRGETRPRLGCRVFARCPPHARCLASATHVNNAQADREINDVVSERREEHLCPTTNLPRALT